MPIGQALESASMQAFSQVFGGLTVIQRRSEAHRYGIVVEPRIEHFEHDLIDKMDNRIRSKITLKVQWESPVWTRSVKSPEAVGTPYAISVSAYTRSVAMSVDGALVGALKIAVADMQGEPQLSDMFSRMEGSNRLTMSTTNKGATLDSI